MDPVGMKPHDPSHHSSEVAVHSHRSVLGTIYSDTVPIHITEATLEQILDYSDRDPSHEVGGFLIGDFESAAGRILVQNFLPAVQVRSESARLTFTHETWAVLNREAEQRFPGQKILGWHHTHPNLGVFLSGYDLFIHRHFFAEAWQVAMVVDPVRQEFGFFQWRGEDVVDCGFICVRAEPS